MIVFMRSEKFGYEEFEAISENDAMTIIKDLLKNIRHLDDGVEREVGVKVNDD